MLAALNMTVSILKLRIGAFIALAALVGVMTGGGELGTEKRKILKKTQRKLSEKMTK